MSRKSKHRQTAIPSPVQNASSITNGLTEAIQGANPLGNQLSQVDTVIHNLRYSLISNMRQILSQSYVEIGLIQTLVDVPVDDAMRGGIEIKSKQLSPEEIEQLQSTVEQEDDITTMSEALKWNRLFGGSGIIIVTGQDHKTPLDEKSLKKGDPLSFIAVDLWELFWDPQNTEGMGMPLDAPTQEFYKYYGKDVHKSRVLTFKGIKAPSFVRPKLRGWGVSVVEVLVRSINQYLKANALTFEILDEFKIDVYKIKNLANTLLSPDGAAKIAKRIALANQQKDYQNAVTMDAEDDFISRELSFAGISETMTGIRMQVASDLRMPLTKVFGISAAGFSSGEDDIQVYNCMVESSIRSKCKHHIIKMIKMRCQVLFGTVPDDLTVSFKPLRILSSEQEENVKTQKFGRLLQARQAGLMSVKEFQDACNKANLLEIQLDTSDEAIDALKEEKTLADEAKTTSPISAQRMSQLNAPEATA